MERIVFLDRASLHAPLRRPAFAHEWVDCPNTAPHEVVERLRGASIVISNKVPVTAQGVTYSTPPGRGNCHWLIVREESGEQVVTATTVHYFSNLGPAPTRLLQRVKNELELIPQPLSREHGRYREGET